MPTDFNYFAPTPSDPQGGYALLSQALASRTSVAASAFEPLQAAIKSHQDQAIKIEELKQRVDEHKANEEYQKAHAEYLMGELARQQRLDDLKVQSAKKLGIVASQLLNPQPAMQQDQPMGGNVTPQPSTPFQYRGATGSVSASDLLNTPAPQAQELRTPMTGSLPSEWSKDMTEEDISKVMGLVNQRDARLEQAQRMQNVQDERRLKHVAQQQTQQAHLADVNDVKLMANKFIGEKVTKEDHTPFTKDDAALSLMRARTPTEAAAEKKRLEGLAIEHSANQAFEAQLDATLKPLEKKANEEGNQGDVGELAALRSSLSLSPLPAGEKSKTLTSEIGRITGSQASRREAAKDQQLPQWARTDEVKAGGEYQAYRDERGDVTRIIASKNEPGYRQMREQAEKEVQSDVRFKTPDVMPTGAGASAYMQQLDQARETAINNRTVQLLGGRPNWKEVENAVDQGAREKAGAPAKSALSEFPPEILQQAEERRKAGDDAGALGILNSWLKTKK